MSMLPSPLVSGILSTRRAREAIALGAIRKAKEASGTTKTLQKGQRRVATDFKQGRRRFRQLSISRQDTPEVKRWKKKHHGSLGNYTQLISTGLGSKSKTGFGQKGRAGGGYNLYKKTANPTQFSYKFGDVQAKSSITETVKGGVWTTSGHKQDDTPTSSVSNRGKGFTFLGSRKPNLRALAENRRTKTGVGGMGTRVTPRRSNIDPYAVHSSGTKY